MSTILGSYSVFVAPGAWTCGPTFRPCESVRVQAGGTVRWVRPVDDTQRTVLAASTVNTATGIANWLAVDASGNAFPLLSSPGQAIFAGVVSGIGGGLLRLPAGNPGSLLEISFGPAGDAFGSTATQDLDAHVEVTIRATQSASVSVAQQSTSGSGNLSAATVTTAYGVATCPWGLIPSGGTVLELASSSSAGFEIDRIRLVTGPAPTPNGYAYPEGTYPPGFAAHAGDADPTSVLGADGWAGGSLLAPGLPPLSLVALAFPDGAGPPLVPTPGCLSLGRLRNLSPADLGAAGAEREDVSYRLWFGVDDAVSSLSSDTGGYSLLVDRLQEPTMPLPLESLIAPRLGRQTSLAARVAVTRMLGCIADKGFKIKADQTWEESGTAGFGVQTGSDLVYDVSSGDVTLNLDTLDTGFVLYGLCGGETVTSPATGVYDHVFTFPVFAQAIPSKHSIELPTESGEMVQRTIDLILNGLKISADPTKLPTASTAFLAGKLVVPEDSDLALAYNGSNTGALTPGANAVQAVSVVGAPTSGSYVLYDEYTQTPSGTINLSDAASAVQTAVRLMGGVYASAVVAGTPVGGLLLNYTITSPTGKRIAKLDALYTGAGGTNTLVGGTAPTVTVAYTNPGGFPISPAARCTAQSWCLSLAPNWTAMENAPVQLTDGWSTEVTIAPRFARKWIQGCAPGAFDYVQTDAKSLKDSMAFEMAFIAQVRQFINSSRSGSRMAARLQSTGAAIGTTGYSRFLRIDMDGQAKWDDNSDSDNVRSIKVTLEALYNMTSGQYVRIVLRNEVASYATM